MQTKTYKEETFKTWDELLLLLEYVALVANELEEIYTFQKQNYTIQKRMQACDKLFLFEDMEVFIDSNIYREIRQKWLEVINNAYKFLQYARSCGGTYGHRVGSLYTFQTKNFEDHKDMLLELESTAN